MEEAIHPKNQRECKSKKPKMKDRGRLLGVELLGNRRCRTFGRKEEEGGRDGGD